MGSKKTMFTLICVLISAVLIIELAGCGTILYPERKGQKDGRIDPGIAVLDGLGLLLFIIPGVIAFAVDFTTGAIYLPGGSRKSSMFLEDEKRVVVRVNPKELSEDVIEEVVRRETGSQARFDLTHVELQVLNSPQEIETKLAEAKKSGYSNY
jgi:hypothetical protein